MKKEQRGVSFPIQPNERSAAPRPVAVGERLYSLAEAADRTNTTVRFWRGLITGGRVRYVKLGKFVRIPEGAINELLAEGTVERTA